MFLARMRARIEGPLPLVTDGSTKEADEPCNCETFTRKETGLRRDRGRKCDARILIGRAFVACRNSVDVVVSSTTHNVTTRSLCAEHHVIQLNHQSCGHCGIFIKQGAALLCPESAKHLTDVKCARAFSTKGNLQCSHCNQLGTAQYMKKEVTVDSVEYMDDDTGYPSSLQQLRSFVRQNQSCDLDGVLIYYMKADRPDLAEFLIKRVVDCSKNEPSGWSSGALLSLAIRRGQDSLVKTMRSIGAPILPIHLFDLADNYSENMFNCLSFDSDFAPTLSASRNAAGYTPLAYGIKNGLWNYCKRLLAHFEKFGADVSTGMGPDELTLQQLTLAAPDHIKQNVRRAGIKFNVRNQFSCKKNIVHDDLSNGSERFPVRVVNDEDGALPETFHYTTRVIDNENILKRRELAESLTCWCTDNCQLDCECSSNVYNSQGRVESVLSAAFLECGSDCLCSMQCSNRVAQKGAKHKIEVFRSADQRGWAVRCLEKIERGSFIGEYTGELLSEEEADKRIDTYLFETAVGEGNYTIDARLAGNFTRFINHSCEPNGEVCMVVWDWQSEQLSHICIFAKRDIACGEEITISYGPHWWKTKVHDFACLCGSAKCEYSVEHRNAMLQAKKGGASSISGSSCSDENDDAM